MTMLLVRGTTLLFLIASFVRPIETMITLKHMMELLQQGTETREHTTNTPRFVGRCLALSVRFIVLLVLIVTRAATEDFKSVHELLQKNEKSEKNGNDTTAMAPLSLLQTDMQHSPDSAEKDEVPPTPPADDEGTKAWHHPVVELDLKTNTETTCLGAQAEDNVNDPVLASRDSAQDEILSNKEEPKTDDHLPVDEPYVVDEEAESFELSNHNYDEHRQDKNEKEEAKEIFKEVLVDDTKNDPSKIIDHEEEEGEEVALKECVDNNGSVTSNELPPHLAIKEESDQSSIPSGLAKAMGPSPQLSATSESQSSLRSPSEGATIASPSTPSSITSRRSSNSTMSPAFKSRLHMAVQKVTSREPHNPGEELSNSPKRTVSTKFQSQLKKSTMRFSKLFHKKN